MREMVREAKEGTVVFSFAFGLLTVITAPIVGALAAMQAGWAFATVTLYGLLAGSLVIAFAWLSFRGTVSWALTELIARELAQRDAETELLSAGQSVVQHNQIDARGMGNQVEVNAPIETVRLVPVNSPTKLIEHLPPAAIAFFVDQYDVRGWSERAWVDCGMRIPGLQEPVDYDTWRQLVAVLEKVGGIAPVQPRTKIKPVLDLQVIKRRALGPGTD